MALGVLLVLLAGMFYPALMLGRRLAPEASLRSAPPWRQEWGPNPEPRARVLAAATQLGPRLAIIGRERLRAALWNPWIGGGRPGWLSSAREGGAPLPVAAALLARPEWAWSALLALTVAVSFSGAWFASRWLGASAWGAAAAAVAYTLAGPVAAHWLDWRGSALALGPLALLPALARNTTWGRATAAWAVAAGVVLLAGPPAVPFVALAVAFETASAPARRRLPRLLAVAAALVLVVIARLPITWLDHFGGEAGASVTATEAPSPSTLWSLVRASGAEPQTVPSRPGIPDSAARAQEPAFLGIATLVLAGIGFAAGAAGQRRFWAAAIMASVLLALAPSAWLAWMGLAQRPLGVLALAMAVLAGLGVDAVCRHTPMPSVRLVGAALCTLLVCELAPPALRDLPFASEHDLQLASPLPFPLPDDGSRIVTMASTLPPDVAATYRLADIRARSFDREPAYQALIQRTTSGAVQALDPDLASLGSRWVLEPAHLRLVSGIVFAEVNVFEARRISADGTATARYSLSLWGRPGRVGIPRSEAEGIAVFLQGGSGTSALEEDRALAEESTAWRWYAVPPGAPSGDIVLGIIGDRQAPPSLSVATDSSGLRIASEGAGLRVWEWARARPFAHLATAIDGGAATLLELGPAHAAFEVDAPQATTLVVQVKHRPGIWRATVNGSPVATSGADAVWTAIPVPAGSSRVVLAAALPTPVWLASLAAAVIIGLLWLGRRSQ